MIILDLIYKLALLVAFSVLSGFISTKYLRTGKANKILQGLLFGIASCIGMYHPFVLTEGIIFDGRSIVISLCTYFFGPVSGIISSIMAIIFRNLLGGSGAFTGTMVIAYSFIIGYLFHQIRVKQAIKTITWFNLYLFGIWVHLGMLLIMFTLPGKYIIETYKTITFTVIGIYPVITLLIGKILLVDEDNKTFINEIKEREAAERKMRQDLASSKEEINKMNLQLEGKIKERTSQLEETNKELEAYSYSISHDLRAPLRAIDGFTRFLEENYSKEIDEEGNKIIQIIRQNSKRMGQLIDDLLAFSKMSNIQIRYTNINMTKIVQEVFSGLAGRSSLPEINFRCEDLIDARADESLIRQVWSNLISNAIKYSSGREVINISISCNREPDRVVFCIRDNGVGFDMKYADKLFGVFQRLHNTAAYEGTGVGLAIVRRIIQRMGGGVWAEGETDKGAAFYFSLPL